MIGETYSFVHQRKGEFVGTLIAVEAAADEPLSRVRIRTGPDSGQAHLAHCRTRTAEGAKVTPGWSEKLLRPSLISRFAGRVIVPTGLNLAMSHGRPVQDAAPAANGRGSGRSGVVRLNMPRSPFADSQTTIPSNRATSSCSTARFVETNLGSSRFG